MPLRRTPAKPKPLSPLGTHARKLAKGILQTEDGALLCYNPQRPLAAGSFGRFFVGLTETDELVGVKEMALLRPKRRADEKPQVSRLENILREHQMARRLKSRLAPSRVFVTTRGKKHDARDNKVLAVLPLMGTCLWSSLDALPTDGALVDVVHRMLLQLLLQLATYHEERVAHCDIKPENILLEHGNALFADFGLAQDVRPAMAHVGSPEYAAPDLLSSSAFNEKVDVWSLGVTMLETLVGFNPFRDPNAHVATTTQMMEFVLMQQKAWSTYYVDMRENVGACAYALALVDRLAVPTGLPLQGLLGAMLTPDPEQRPSAWDLLLVVRNWAPLSPDRDAKVQAFWRSQEPMHAVARAAAPELKTARERALRRPRQA